MTWTEGGADRLNAGSWPLCKFDRPITVGTREKRELLIIMHPIHCVLQFLSVKLYILVPFLKNYPKCMLSSQDPFKLYLHKECVTMS